MVVQVETPKDLERKRERQTDREKETERERDQSSVASSASMQHDFAAVGDTPPRDAVAEGDSRLLRQQTPSDEHTLPWQQWGRDTRRDVCHLRRVNIDP